MPFKAGNYFPIVYADNGKNAALVTITGEGKMALVLNFNFRSKNKYRGGQACGHAI